MPQTIPFKQGDTFLIENTVKSEGAPLDLAGWGVIADIRYQGALVCALTVSRKPELGVYRLTSPTPTDSWPVGELSLDIQYTSPEGQIISTETVSIGCVEGGSRGY